MLTFQDVILRLQTYWAEQGALIWQPYSEKVGAGTMNPATPALSARSASRARSSTPGWRKASRW